MDPFAEHEVLAGGHEAVVVLDVGEHAGGRLAESGEVFLFVGGLGEGGVVGGVLAHGLAGEVDEVVVVGGGVADLVFGGKEEFPGVDDRHVGVDVRPEAGASDEGGAAGDGVAVVAVGVEDVPGLVGGLGGVFPVALGDVVALPFPEVGDALAPHHVEEEFENDGVVAEAFHGDAEADRVAAFFGGGLEEAVVVVVVDLGEAAVEVHAVPEVLDGAPRPRACHTIRSALSSLSSPSSRRGVRGRGGGHGGWRRGSSGVGSFCHSWVGIWGLLQNQVMRTQVPAGSASFMEEKMAFAMLEM